MLDAAVCVDFTVMKNMTVINATHAPTYTDAVNTTTLRSVLGLQTIAAHSRWIKVNVIITLA